MSVQSSRTALANYLFLGVGGAVTVTGIFKDEYGVQQGVGFTYSVPAGDGTNNPVTLATMYGAALPSTAEQADIMVAASGAVWYAAATDATTTADFKANYAKYPTLLDDFNPHNLGKAGNN
jgi:hypothetical protein